MNSQMELALSGAILPHLPRLAQALAGQTVPVLPSLAKRCVIRSIIALLQGRDLVNEGVGLDGARQP